MVDFAALNLKQNEMRDIAREVEALQNRVVKLIDGTPTGIVRNRLTEANIHLMQTQDAMRKAIAREGEG